MLSWSGYISTLTNGLGGTECSREFCLVLYARDGGWKCSREFCLMSYMNRVWHNTRQTCVSAQGEGNILLIKIVYIPFKARGEKSFIK